jgi:uncharacterized membrane protein HdeD (DUF308 family)
VRVVLSDFLRVLIIGRVELLGRGFDPVRLQHRLGVTIVQGISLIGAQNVPHFWLQLVSVVLSVIVGVLFLRHPGEGLLTLTLLLIVFFMVEGMSKIIFALTIRPFPNWGWVLVSGVIGILLSF